MERRQSQVITLRYFGGLTVPEVAEALGVSVVTVETGLAAGAGLARRPAPRGGRMTPERWRRIGDLFDAALRLDPAGREAWLREACGDDEGLRAEVGRLLAQDERAARDGFLTASEAPGEAPGRTASWSSPGGRRPPRGPAPIDLAGAATSDTTGFSPRAAITAGSPQPISAAESMVRARLGELPMIFHAITFSSVNPNVIRPANVFLLATPATPSTPSPAPSDHPTNVTRFPEPLAAQSASSHRSFVTSASVSVPLPLKSSRYVLVSTP